MARKAGPPQTVAPDSLSLSTGMDKLSFDSEFEVNDLFSRLRDELSASFEVQKRSFQVDRLSRAESIIFDDFFQEMKAVLLANCVVSGRSFSLSTREYDGPLPDLASTEGTEPFNEDLNDKVATEQDKLFADRALSAVNRRKLFQTAETTIKDKIDADKTWISKVEKAVAMAPEPPHKRRKTVDALSTEKIQKIEANYAASARDINLLQEKLPSLNTKLADAIQVGRDVKKL